MEMNKQNPKYVHLAAKLTEILSNNEEYVIIIECVSFLDIFSV